MAAPSCSSSGLSVTELQALSDHAVACLNTPSHKTLTGALHWLREVAECDRIVLCQLDSRSDEKLHKLINHSYSEGWLSLYQKMHFHRVDPVLKWAEKTSGTFRWSDAYETNSSPQEKRFLNLARDHGLADGLAHSYCQRTGGRDLTTVCSLPTNTPKLRNKLSFALNCLVPTLHFSASTCEISSIGLLTKRETETLKWAAVGKTVWELSKLLSISQATVKFHLSNIYRKLNVLNRAQAVSAAIKAGLI